MSYNHVLRKRSIPIEKANDASNEKELRVSNAFVLGCDEIMCQIIKEFFVSDNYSNNCYEENLGINFYYKLPNISENKLMRKYAYLTAYKGEPLQETQKRTKNCKPFKR